VEEIIEEIGGDDFNHEECLNSLLQEAQELVSSIDTEIQFD